METKTDKTFEELLKENTKVIKYIVGKFERNESDAEDLLQDSLLKAYINFKSWNPKLCKFSSWLSNIIHNTYVDKYRKIKNGPNFTNLDLGHDNLDILNIVSGSDKSVLDEFEDRETEILTQKLLAKLSDKLRGPFEMFLNDYSQKDIAKKFSISVEVVKSRVFMAKKIIKKIYPKKK